MKKIISKRGLSLSLILVFLLSGCANNSVEKYPFNFSGPTMGTSFSVKASQLPQGVKTYRLETLIKNRLDEINQRMSTYISDSEVALINSSPNPGATFITPELEKVMLQAQEISELSNGAFDITVAPLVNLWGFGPEKTDNKAPKAEEIQQVLEVVNYKNLVINKRITTLSKTKPDVAIDLSSLAKGYAVDEVAKVLDKQGITDYMVEIGGELYLKGKNLQGENWHIAIEKPNAEKRELQRVLPITDIAMATSGDYRNFFEQDGKRFSHTIDPRTGYPITHKLASVTVLSDTTMKADAWATALMVLGEEEGYKIAEQQKLVAFFIIKTDQGFVEKETPAFSEQTKVEQ
ncbi:FAD:protein FMN transferase [Bathymodiolus japonicus methanotrophic gill symbiont]|nr:FAD:protein FMN transferase [Bathymodiolus japonicus methanotrophic gill symbiont]